LRKTSSVSPEASATLLKVPQPFFIAIKGAAWDREKSEAFVQMFAEMGIRAIAGHNDDVVVLTIYDREAAEEFVDEMRTAGIDATLASSKEAFLKQARE
jgi:hypothetical protein